MPKSYMRTSGLVILLGIAVVSVAAEKDTKEKSIDNSGTAVVNEIGKGFEAIGKAVGPAVNKAEKTVRGGAKNDAEKRPVEPK